VDGSQGALVEPGSIRGSLHTKAGRCAHSARVKPWTSERGLEPGKDPQGECSKRGIANREETYRPLIDDIILEMSKRLRSPVQVGKATGGLCPVPE
jgi:hypothetical protein